MSNKETVYVVYQDNCSIGYKGIGRKPKGVAGICSTKEAALAVLKNRQEMAKRNNFDWKFSLKEIKI